MVTHMKTTIDISDHLFEQTRAFADKKKSTFREVVETALRSFLNAQKSRPKVFKLRDASVGGKGLAEGLSEGMWEEIRKMAYEGRGG